MQESRPSRSAALRQHLRKLEDWVSGGLALLALLVSCYGILARYLLPGLLSDWVEEVTIYSIMWAIWLSAARLVADDRHVKSDLAARLTQPRLQRLLAVFRALCGLGFCALICWKGLDVVRLALRLGERSSSTLQFPMAFYYASMPVGLALMALRYAVALRAALAAYPVNTKSAP